MKVYLDASCDIQYSSYYIYGLYKIYGRNNVRFSSKYFKTFKHDNHFFAFVIEDDAHVKKVVIDFTDSSVINESALDWCDVYGKINIDKKMNLSPKVIPIGPSFGIRIFGLAKTLWYAMTNLFRAYQRIPNIRKFLSDYKAQFKRPKFTDYNVQASKAPFVFFMSSLWKQEAQTNRYRANFIERCQANPHIDFEGGFAPRTKDDIRGFEALTTEGRVSMKAYLNKTKTSFLVFNTPAVKGCHGWKLAEYLCLGKAILSTPLSRALPAPLIDQEQLLYTDGSPQDITAKINTIVGDPELQLRLETQAKRYFDQNLHPEVVVKRLIAH